METHRKAGAPRGNHNALKHGFYAKTFKLTERRELESVNQLSLNAEIDMLRVVVRRVFDLTPTLQDPIVALRYVHLLTRAVTSLDRLVARQNDLHNEKDDFNDEVQDALEKITDFKNERRDDLKKRYAIQRAVLHRRLDAIVPPPPGTLPAPDPSTLPQPDRDLDSIDPYCCYYETIEPAYYSVYSEESAIVSRSYHETLPGVRPYGYIHPDDVMKQLAARQAPPPAAAVPAASDAGDDDLSDADLFDDPSTYDPDEDEAQVLPPLSEFD